MTLLPETAAILDCSPDERIRHLRSGRWIGYGTAKVILNRLQELFDFPKTHRMPNLLIVGETNNGKTAIANRFHQLHEPINSPDSEATYLPVLIIQAPPVPDERRFMAALLDKLAIPHKTNERADRMMFQALELFPKLRTKMLIVDEIHAILAGPLPKQRAFLNVIKYLGNELQIPIVGVGTRDAFNALQTDPQLANRFEPAPVPRWQNNREYLRLLASFERMLCLKRESNLADGNLPSLLIALSEGTIGELSSLLVRASIEAIESGEERITSSLLNRLVENVQWIPPSERRKRAAALL